MATNISGTVTNLSDNFVPAVWLGWVNDRINATNAFFKSGVIAQDPVLGARLLEMGRFVTIPHTAHIDSSIKPQTWDNEHDITTNPMDSYTENDVKIYETQSFGNSQFDDLITGTKTLEQITAQFGDYWGDVDEARAIQIANIAYLNATIKEAKSYGIGKEAEFKAEDFTKAMARIGDVTNGRPTQMAVNSGTYQFMLKNNLIAFTAPSVGATPIASYNGLTILQDDKVPLTKDGKTVAYIFGAGAINYASATAPKGITVTQDDLTQGGISAITHKRVVTCHLAGTSADMSVESDPTKWKEDIEAGTKALFKPQKDLRDIHMVEYAFTIDPDYVVPGVNTTDTDTAAATTDSATTDEGKSA